MQRSILKDSLWLVTSGGTKVPIDTVRDITNMSKGTFGCKIMTEALKRGNRVHGLIATGSKSPFDFCMNFWRQEDAEIAAMIEMGEMAKFALEYRRCYVENEYRNFNDYEKSLAQIMETRVPDVVILAAAVSDYGVKPMAGKIRSGSDMTIELRPLPKLISRIKAAHPNCYLVGFKLLVNSTDEELEAAVRHSIETNHCDLVVGNDLRDIKAGKHRLLLGKTDGKSITITSHCADPKDPSYLAEVVVDTITEQQRWPLNTTSY